MVAVVVAHPVAAALAPGPLLQTYEQRSLSSLVSGLGVYLLVRTGCLLRRAQREVPLDLVSALEKVVVVAAEADLLCLPCRLCRLSCQSSSQVVAQAEFLHARLRTDQLFPLPTRNFLLPTPYWRWSQTLSPALRTFHRRSTMTLQIPRSPSSSCLFSCLEWC